MSCLNNLKKRRQSSQMPYERFFKPMLSQGKRKVRRTESKYRFESDGETVKNYIINNYGDLTAWLNNQIEATINLLKNS